MARGFKSGGRIKGTPNKVSRTVKENVVAVFDELGGRQQMTTWARENQTEFYRLYARLLPTEVSGPDSEAIPVNVDLGASVLELIAKIRG